MGKMLPVFSLFIFLFAAADSFAGQTIIAKKVESPPVINGKGDDLVWKEAKKYTVGDDIAKVEITLKAVYTDTEIFFLASFPDKDESAAHKFWVWDEKEQMYKTGPLREDTLIFKWHMAPQPIDLSLKSGQDYFADIWFWKACRSNPVGYLDDKYQRYSSTKLPKSYEIEVTGEIRHLLREGDSGTAAYKNVIYTDYEGDNIRRYINLVPTGSRADIRGKGIWSDGRWTIELGRRLLTGNNDDVQFDTSKTYFFGVSLYEIAGRPPDPDIEKPLYGSGDIGEVLSLHFGDRK